MYLRSKFQVTLKKRTFIHMKSLCSFFFILLFFKTCFCQEGEWQGFITQDGQQYEMIVEFKKDGNQIIGYTHVVIGDSIYGGKIYGRFYKDRSMNLWDHLEQPEIFPDTLPPVMRRRYQLLYKRSTWGDTIKGHWQQVHKGINEFYKKGMIELHRFQPDTKA